MTKRKLFFGLAGLLIAGLVAWAPVPVAAIQVNPLSASELTVDLEASGQSRAEAIAELKRRAVRASAGRVLLDGQLLLADHLLAQYLNNYAEQFVTAVEILDERFVAGVNHVRARVYLDYAFLVQDMEAKKFLFQPAYNPDFATYMTERLNGSITDTGEARVAIANALGRMGMRPYENQLATPPSSADVGADDFLFEAAVVASQRSGVEIIVTGEASTTQTDQKQLYFDTYYFFESTMTASMIRVDTGEVLATARASGSGGDRDQGEAARMAIERAAEGVAAELAPKYRERWPVLVQDKAQFQILLTGAESDLVRIVQRQLERMGRNVEVHLRKQFDTSAVLTVVYDGPKEDVITTLRACPYPTLTVLNPEASNRFEVQVSG